VYINFLTTASGVRFQAKESLALLYRASAQVCRELLCTVCVVIDYK